MQASLTLGRWFLVWMVIVTVLVLSLSLAVVTARGHAVLSQQLVERGTAVARSLAKAADEPAAGAAALAALPECVAVTMLENSSLVWAYGPDPARALALDPSLVMVQQVVAPDSSSERSIEVTLVLSLASVRAQVVDAAARLAISLTVALGLTLIAGVLLVNRVVEPIKVLSNRVRGFRPDQPPPPVMVKAGASEVTELARSFNAMAERLAEQRRSLVESEGRFRELFMGSPSPLLEVDDKLEVIDANPAARSFLAAGRGQLQGRCLADLLDDHSARRMADVVARRASTEGSIEGHWLLPGGDEIEVDLQLSEVGEVSADQGSNWLVAVHDLSDRLRQMGEQWRHTFNEMTDGVALLADDGKVMLSNRAIEPFLPHLREHVAAVTEAAERHEWRLELEGRSLRCLLIRPASLGRRILVVRDDTDWLKAEERLREAHKMSAVATLAGGVAHDFNNLLAGILLQVRLLERSPDSRETAAEAIGVLAEEGAAVVRGLIQFAQPEAAPREPLDLAALVADQEPLLRHLMPPSVEVTSELESAWVVGSPSELRRVVLNLVVNARAVLSDVGGRVTLRVRNEAAECVLEISDNGPGVPVEDRERIFEPFFTRRRDGRGAGIGLAVVYAVVREHEGHVTVAEADGGGAQFTVRLPRTSKRSAVGESEDRVPAEVSGGLGERVMVVDDEQVIAARLAEELAIAGYEVRCADSARVAREICQTWLPQVMVIDLLLKDGNGWELVEELRRGLGPVPVLFASGNLEQFADRIAQLPSSVAVAKPFRVDHLLAELSGLLRTGEGSTV